MGDVNDLIQQTWVCIPKCGSLSTILSLFSKRNRMNGSLVHVEKELLTHCHPFTIGQQCADWFVLHQFRVTGTMALTLREDMSSNQVIDMAFCSWFSRTKSMSAMVEGTKNEVPTLSDLRNYDFITNLFEVELLEMVHCPYLAVSADGVATIKTQDGNEALCSVEIKMRVASQGKINAIENEKEYSHIIECVYNDDLFKKCVPAEHRKQILHQAAVIN